MFMHKIEYTLCQHPFFPYKSLGSTYLILETEILQMTALNCIQIQ